MKLHEHWLLRAARETGLASTDRLCLKPGIRLDEAWQRVAASCGIDQFRLAESVATFFSLDLADMTDPQPAALKLLPAEWARRNLVLPLRQNDEHIVVAVADPGNILLEEDIRFTTGRRPALRVASPAALRSELESSYSPDDASQVRPPERSSRHSAHLRILVVDDNPVDRHLARLLLEHSHFEVEEAVDGLEALEVIKRGMPFAAVVSDLDMPDLDGRGLLEALRSSAAYTSIPVLIQTGSSDPNAEAALIEAGADDYVRKPLNPARFIARVRAMLRRTSAQSDSYHRPARVAR